MSGPSTEKQTLSMLNTNLKSTLTSKRSALLFGLLLFFVNMAGFTIFRFSMSNDLFGGDIYSFTRDTNSYSLAYRDILKPNDLFRNLLSEKNAVPETSPNAFAWSHLSDQGRGAVERLSSGGGTDWDKELFVMELNKALVDPPTKWPEQFLPQARSVALRKTGISVKEYNLRMLAELFPEISAPTHLDKVSLGSLAVNAWNYLPHLFTLKQPTRYAPLSALYSTTLNNYLRNSPERILSAVVFQASIYALLMTLVFFLAWEVLASIPWAFFSVLLFQTAVSTLLSTYTIFCLPYFFVPLVMVAALLCYLSYKNSGQKRYLIGFILLAIAGPWFREFAGLIPYVVLANEVLNFQKKRSVVVMAVCVLLCAHSVYPSFLTWLVGLNKGVFFSVYAQNNRQQLVTSVWNWMSPGMLFVEIPPVLWLIAWISAFFWVLRSKWADLVGEPCFWGMKWSFPLLSGSKTQKVLRTAIVLLMILVAWLVAHHFFGQYRDTGWQHPGMGAALGKSVLALILILSLFSLRSNTLIPIYFMAVFLPFMRIGGNTEVHLSFALAPLSILVLSWVKKSYEMLALRTKGLGRNLGLVGLSLFFVLGMIDQASNVWACISSQRAVVRVNKEIANWIRTNVERHSVVVCNFFNFYDVFYYSDYYFDPYETVENCPMGPGNVVHADSDFERLAEKYFSRTPFYFLANRIPYYEYQKDYHSHKYVKTPPGTLEELKRFPLKNTYPYFDPLKFFIMRRFQTLPLYMDWSIDFYYNNTGTPFQRVVSAEYTLYRLKDLVKPIPAFEMDPGAAAPMLVTDHRKYNIVYFNKIFYAVPQSLGTLDLASEEDRARPGILVAQSGEEAKKLIDQVTASSGLFRDSVVMPGESPRLVMAHKKYNVVRYKELFYIVPQSLGPLDLVKEKDRTLPGIFVKDTLEEAQRLIDEIAAATPRTSEPPKLVKRYMKYNIVRYKELFYALPQSLGPLDLARAEDRSRPGIFTGSSLVAAQQLIDGSVATGPGKVPRQPSEESFDPAGPPMLVTDHNGYNIVFYADGFYAVPQSLGPMDLAIEANRMRPEIVTGSSVKKAKRNIDKALTKRIQARLRKAFYSFLRWLNKGWGPS